MKNIVYCVAAFAAAISTQAGATTFDFEDGTVGSPVITAGATYLGAEYKACGGGCPAPDFGLFISSADYFSPFTITFDALQSSVGFVNVSFSSVLAQAFDSSGNLLGSLTDSESFPIDGTTLTLSGAGISYVTFQGNGSTFGIDNLTYSDTPAVPEPASWAMMIAGFGLTGAALRRRSTKVSFAA